MELWSFSPDKAKLPLIGQHRQEGALRSRSNPLLRKIGPGKGTILLKVT